MYKYFNKTKEIGRYVEALALRTRDPTVQREDKKVVFMLLNIWRLHLDSNIFISQCDLIKNIFKMISLYQNMKSLVLFQKTCVPNRVQIQLSVGVINIWLVSASTQPVILNSTNSWSYINLFWLNNNMDIVWCDIIIFVFSSAYLHFTEYDQLAWSQNVIHNSFLS